VCIHVSDEQKKLVWKEKENRKRSVSIARFIQKVVLKIEKWDKEWLAILMEGKREN
jgi:hypothetical protein